LKVDKPVGKGLPQNFDLIFVLDQSWVVSQCEFLPAFAMAVRARPADD
jgi:hypothetical protein